MPELEARRHIIIRLAVFRRNDVANLLNLLDAKLRQLPGGVHMLTTNERFATKEK